MSEYSGVQKPVVNPEGKFVIKNKVMFKDVIAGKVRELPESDLMVQDDVALYQFKFERPESDFKTIISPGIFTLMEENGMLVLKKSELRKRKLLASVANTKAIIDEANIFFNNLDVYDFLEEPKARKILIHSAPGYGKTSVLTQYCEHAILEDKGTVVLIWPTSQIDSDAVLNFLSKSSMYEESCTRVILLIEDIGGGEREGNMGARHVDSALLDLLDGLQITFKLPTLIIATTNYPENLLSALADRPGRFDLIMALKALSYQEKIDLVEFIAKRLLTQEEKEVFAQKKVETFSPAHLKEVVVRSMLHKKTMGQIVKQLIEHRENFKKNFEAGSGEIRLGGLED